MFEEIIPAPQTVEIVMSVGDKYVYPLFGEIGALDDEESGITYRLWLIGQIAGSVASSQGDFGLRGRELLDNLAEWCNDFANAIITMLNDELDQR